MAAQRGETNTSATVGQTISSDVSSYALLSLSQERSRLAPYARLAAELAGRASMTKTASRHGELRARLVRLPFNSCRARGERRPPASETKSPDSKRGRSFPSALHVRDPPPGRSSSTSRTPPGTTRHIGWLPLPAAAVELPFVEEGAVSGRMRLPGVGATVRLPALARFVAASTPRRWRDAAAPAACAVDVAPRTAGALGVLWPEGLRVSPMTDPVNVAVCIVPSPNAAGLTLAGSRVSAAAARGAARPAGAEASVESDATVDEAVPPLAKRLVAAVNSARLPCASSAVPFK
eukprot:scaffold18751_cov245-Isochrysis_galbana.AAC.6